MTEDKWGVPPFGVACTCDKAGECTCGARAIWESLGKLATCSLHCTCDADRIKKLQEELKQTKEDLKRAKTEAEDFWRSACHWKKAFEDLEKMQGDAFKLIAYGIKAERAKWEAALEQLIKSLERKK